MTNQTIDAGAVRELLDYDPNSGIFRWRVCRGPVKTGDIADNVDSHGYVRIEINGRSYKARRLAFLIMRGRWPADEIDHINRNPVDNRWCNLREASHAEGMRNRSLQKNNKFGRPGIQKKIKWKISNPHRFCWSAN
jgi:HNH endonuclease